MGAYIAPYFMTPLKVVIGSPKVSDFQSNDAFLANKVTRASHETLLFYLWSLLLFLKPVKINPETDGTLESRSFHQVCASVVRNTMMTDGTRFRSVIKSHT